MAGRLPYYSIAPEPYKAMLALEAYFAKSSLEPVLKHLVKLRVSQINGCAYCIDMHWKDLRALGESEARLYGLDAWEETPLYSDREKAALAWAEALTHISETHASDVRYEAVRRHFNDQELTDLTFVIATINSWNRLAISFRAEPGHYKSHLQPKPA
jgi:AhpD family alkylhydroperoxidase